MQTRPKLENESMEPLLHGIDGISEELGLAINQNKKSLKLMRTENCGRVRLLAVTVLAFFLIYISITLPPYELPQIVVRIPPEDNTTVNNHFEQTSVPEGYLIWSPQCKIASFDPLSPDVMKLFSRERQDSCSTKKPLTNVLRDESGNTILFVDELAKKNYDLNHLMICCYQEIFRNNKTRKADTDIRLSQCNYFTESIELAKSVEFIYVHCAKKTKPLKILYKNVHAIVQDREHIEQRFQNYSTSNGSTVKRPVSVLLIGIDSISRLNLLRAMPKTAQYLYDNGWFEMKGYNKIDDNTFPNLMAILTGYNNSMAYSVCDPKKKYFLDRCPILWYTFRDLGYATAYAEDETWMSTFNYNSKEGFVDPPTDYYIRPAMIAADKYLDVKKKSNMHFCDGFQHSADYIYQYAIDFAQVYQGKPYFGLFWTNTFSHNDIKDPSSMDEKMKWFLEEMDGKGIFNDSVVVFFSDHGMRFGPIRKLIIGWSEERLPFMFISLPPWFQKEYPEIVQALRINRSRLTNPYDLHMTLKHILKLSGRDQTSLTGAPSCPNCLSLFEEVPWNRSCEEISIAPHWCTCNAYKSVEKSSHDVKMAIRAVIGYMNDEISNVLNGTTDIKGKELCAKLKLNKILLAGETRYKSEINDFLVQFEVKPGGGEFESTVRYYKKSGTYSVSSSISRLNSYGKTSYCVSQDEIKKYCYCNKQKS